MSTAAKQYNISRQAIHQAIRSGRLPAKRIDSDLISQGWLYMFSRKDFERVFNKSLPE